MPRAIHWMGSRRPASGIGLAEEGEEELCGAGGGEGEGQGVAGVVAARELAEKEDGEEGRDDAA